MMDQGAYYDGNAYPVQPEYGDVGQPQKRRFYWCSLVVVNVCSLISYSIMASAKHYGEFTALEFTVGAGVLSWLSSGFLLVYQCFAHKTNSDISTDPHRFLLAVHLHRHRFREQRVEPLRRFEVLGFAAQRIFVVGVFAWGPGTGVAIYSIAESSDDVGGRGLTRRGERL